MSTTTTTAPGFFTGTGMPDPGWWEALFPDPQKILAGVGLKSGMTALDLCSGDGWFTLAIAHIARHVVAIDIDAELLKIAKSRLAPSGTRNCEFIEGDAYDLTNLVPAPVDFVFLANAFHGAPDRPRLARAVRSILKPGGRFAIINWHAHPREETVILGEPRGPATELRMTPDSVVSVVEPSGLLFRDLIEIAPYHYGAVFENPG